MIRNVVKLNARSSSCIRETARYQSAQVRPQAASEANVDPEWANALPYSKIPGPSVLHMLKEFAIPGGRYKNLTVPVMHRRFREDYGDLIRLPGALGRRDTIMSYSPDDYEKLFRTEGTWPNRRAMDSFVYYRKHVRPDVFKGMGGLVTEMKNIRDEKNELPADFSQWLNRWALETMGVIALDTRLGVLDSQESGNTAQIVEHVRVFFELSYQLDVLPSIWKYYKTPKFIRLMKTLDELTSIVMGKVDEAVIRMEKNPTAASDTQSVLEKLLKVNRDVAIIMAYDMLLAGVDTSSSGTIGILYCLATNPDKQSKLRAELRTILPTKDSPLTAENMRNLPYLRACIKEGLRVCPPTAGNIRAAGKDIVLQGYQIPKGTDVAMASMVLQQGDEHFVRGKEFLPERWLKEQECPSARDVHPFLYLPFGFGARSCIGRRLAMLEMEMIVARVTRLFEYRWNYDELRIRGSLINIPDNDLKFQMDEVQD